MTKEQINTAKALIWKQLDYWCEQYKYANEVSHDINECERISKNIVALEQAYKAF